MKLKIGVMAAEFSAFLEFRVNVIIYTFMERSDNKQMPSSRSEKE